MIVLRLALLAAFIASVLSSHLEPFDADHSFAALERRTRKRYTYADILKCKLPATNYTIPARKWRTPGPMLWYSLNMDAWLQAVFKACPAATVQSDFPRALGKLMIGRNEYLECGATATAGCQWSAQRLADGQRLPGPDETPSLFDRKGKATMASINLYRRWYALQALRQMNIYYDQLATAFTDATAIQSANLPTFIAAFGPQPTVPVGPSNSFSLSDLSNIIGTLVSFIPFGTVASDLFKGASAVVQTELSAAQQIAKYDTQQKAKSLLKAIGSTLFGGPSASPSSPPSESVAQQMINSFNNFTSQYSAMLQGASTQIDTLWQDAIQQAPLSKNGFVAKVKAGTFSAISTDSPLLNAQATKNFGQYLLEKLLMLMLESQSVFFLRSSDVSCNTGSGWTMSGCVPTSSISGNRSDTSMTTFFATTPIQYVIPLDVYVNAFQLPTQSYTTLDPTSLATYGINLTDIATGSARCSDATNRAFLTSPPVDLLAQYASNNLGSPQLANLTLWPAESQPRGRQTPLTAQCHFNVPALDTTSIAAQGACEAFADFCWVSGQTPSCPDVLEADDAMALFYMSEQVYPRPVYGPSIPGSGENAFQVCGGDQHGVGCVPGDSVDCWPF